MEAAREYARAGVAPGGTHANWKFLADWVTFAEDIPKDEQLLLCDAQTSGGLLAAVPAEDAERVIGELRSAGTLAADVVGRVTAVGDGKIRVARRR